MFWLLWQTAVVFKTDKSHVESMIQWGSLVAQTLRKRCIHFANVKTWPVQSVKSCVLTPEIFNFLFNPGPWSRQEETEINSSLMGFTQNPTSLFHNLPPPPGWHSGRWFSVSFLPFSDTSFPAPLYSLWLKPKEASLWGCFNVFTAPQWAAGYCIIMTLATCWIFAGSPSCDLQFGFSFHRELFSLQQTQELTSRTVRDDTNDKVHHINPESIDCLHRWRKNIAGITDKQIISPDLFWLLSALYFKSHAEIEMRDSGRSELKKTSCVYIFSLTIVRARRQLRCSTSLSQREPIIVLTLEIQAESLEIYFKR